jgi:hypothetical protein
MQYIGVVVLLTLSFLPFVYRTNRRLRSLEEQIERIQTTNS